MSKEQKEGVVIVVISALALLIIAINTDWKYSGLTDAAVRLGFSMNCPYWDPDNGCYVNDESETGYSNYMWVFYIKFKTFLSLLLPVILYGVLRSFKIINRLIPFEERLFRFIKE